jgi:hypothetical protein
MRRMALRERSGRFLLCGLVSVGAAVAVAACGGSSSGSSGSQSSSEMLARAADASSKAAGYKMSMVMHEAVEGKNIGIHAHGAVSTSGPSADMIMRTSVAGAGAYNMRVLLDKGSIYMKLPSSLASQIPGGKPWLTINLNEAGKAAGVSDLGSLESNSSSLTNPGQYLDFLRATSKGSVTTVGTATVNGIKTTHYRAKVDIDKLASAVPASDRKAMKQLVATLKQDSKGHEFAINAWIDGSNYIRRLSVNYNLTVEGVSAKVKMTENILSYGPQAKPTLPSKSETTNLLSLEHSESGAE